MRSDGNYSTPQKNGPRRWSAPLPTNEFYQFEQDYMQSAASWTATDLATPCPDAGFSKYFLVKESDHRPLGSTIQWTRTYAKLPTSWEEPELFTYDFPGLSIAFPGYLVSRAARSVSVLSKLQRDYFLIDPNSAPAPLANRYQNDTDIPPIEVMRYCLQVTVSGSTYGGIFAVPPNNTLPPDATATVPALPSNAQYAGMVKNAFDYGWNATKTKIVIITTTTGGVPTAIIDTTNTVYGGLIPAEPSRLTRLIGPIFERQSRYVLAQ